MPESLGVKVGDILGRIGFHRPRELHLGVKSVLFMVDLLVDIAACSVRSR